MADYDFNSSINDIYKQANGGINNEDFINQTLGKLSPEDQQKFLEVFKANDPLGMGDEFARKIGYEGTSDPRWQTFLRMGNETFKSGKLAPGAKPAAAGPTGPTAADQANAARTQQRGDVTKQIQDFINRMNQPSVGPDGKIIDPVVKQLATMGMNTGMQGANDRGIAGGAASSAGRAMAEANSLPYLQQKNQLAQQGIGMLANQQASNESLDQGLERLRQGAYGLDLTAKGMNDQQQMNAYGQKVAGAQGIGGMIGGAIGGIGAGIFSGGNPAAIGAGLSAGASIGGGIGGQTAGSAPSLAPYKPYTGGAA